MASTSDSPQQRLIAELGLVPHPEGGFYRKAFRDSAGVLRGGDGDGAERSAPTAIYYLPCGDAYSTWHRIRADEAWHFYAGDPIHVHWLAGDGALAAHVLGNPLVHAGAIFQAVVPASRWFAAERVPGLTESGYALAGCTVAPGFEFSEFELADVSALAAARPKNADLLRRLNNR